MPVAALIVRPPTPDEAVMTRAARALGKVQASGSVGRLRQSDIEAMALALVILGLHPVLPDHPKTDPNLKREPYPR